MPHTDARLRAAVLFTSLIIPTLVMSLMYSSTNFSPYKETLSIFPIAFLWILCMVAAYNLLCKAWETKTEKVQNLIITLEAIQGQCPYTRHPRLREAFQKHLEGEALPIKRKLEQLMGVPLVLDPNQATTGSDST